MSIKLAKKPILLYYAVICCLAILVMVLGGLVIAGNNRSNGQFVVTPGGQSAGPTGGQNAGQGLGNNVELAKILDCTSTEGQPLNVCYDKFIGDYVGDKTVKNLLSDLEMSRSTSSSMENSCHPVAHAIGRYSLTKHGNVGDAFEACDYTCHSGCYHGVMERLFFTEEQITAGLQHLGYDQLAQKVPGICLPANFKNPSKQILFQCLHGIGHAILYTIDYKLEQGLALCDLLPGSFERESCYGGLIMENVTAYEKSKRDIQKDNPHYPCNKLDAKYQYSCYAMQTSVMFDIGLSADEIAKECLNAGSQVETCFISLGRDLSNNIRTGGSAYVQKVCTNSGQYAENCIRGAIYAVIDNTWDGKYALPFCEGLTEPLKTDCLQRALNYLQYSHEKTQQELEDSCKQFALSSTDLCLGLIKTTKATW